MPVWNWGILWNSLLPRQGFLKADSLGGLAGVLRLMAGLSVPSVPPGVAGDASLLVRCRMELMRFMARPMVPRLCRPLKSEEARLMRRPCSTRRTVLPKVESTSAREEPAMRKYLPRLRGAGRGRGVSGVRRVRRVRRVSVALRDRRRQLWCVHTTGLLAWRAGWRAMNVFALTGGPCRC
jgi:hypothetical protein